IDKISDYS
ncbi:hypothetical protein JL09_g6635, partial [Pichia kudriavzevii]